MDNKMPSNRCVTCKKKSLVNVKCKCGKMVCITHAFPPSHQCTYDHAKDEKEKLEKDMKIDIKPSQISVI